MEMLGIASLVSIALFCAAGWLHSRSRVPPPMEIRSPSGRSPAEYAFRAQVSIFRKSSELCILVGVLNFIVAFVMLLISMIPTH
jgi:hypothetical protein